MMNRGTLKIIRDLYYVGIAILVLLAIPAVQGIVAPVLAAEVTSGVTWQTVIAILVGLGAYQAYRRKL